MEPDVSLQLYEDYGINSDWNMGHNEATDAFFADLVHVFQALELVANNGPVSIGGGGEPLGPLAPPICGTGCPPAPAGQ